MIPTLDLNYLSYIRENAFLQLSKIVKGKKSFIVDEDVDCYFNLIYSASQLTELNVVSYDILTDQPIITKHELVYIIHPTLTACKLIAEHLKINQKPIHVIFIPYTNIQCTYALDMYMKTGIVKIYSLPIYFIPIDNDVLSLENAKYLKQIYVDLDLKADLNMVNGLVQLQEHIGIIPQIQGLGSHSQFIIETMLKDIKGNYNISNVTNIKRLIILDRSTDYITPLLSENSYAGLVHENYHIEKNTIKIPNYMYDSKMKSDNYELKTKVINDVVFREIRDEHIDVAAKILTNKIKEKSSIIKSIDKQADVKTISDSIKKYIAIPEELLIVHFNIIESLLKNDEFENLEFDILHHFDWYNKHEYKNRLNEFIKNDKSPLRIIRLLCLYCSVNDGIDSSYISSIQSSLINQYGIHCVFMIEHLFQVGLLFHKTNIYFHNLMTDFDCFAFNSLYNEYTPLSYRIIESILNTNLEVKQNKLLGGIGSDKTLNKKLAAFKPFHHVTSEIYETKNPIVIICFVGGVTYSEIALLRKLGQQLELQFLFITSKIIGGNDLIQSLK